MVTVLRQPQICVTQQEIWDYFETNLGKTKRYEFRRQRKQLKQPLGWATTTTAIAPACEEEGDQLRGLSAWPGPGPWHRTGRPFEEGQLGQGVTARDRCQLLRAQCGQKAGMDPPGTPGPAVQEDVDTLEGVQRVTKEQRDHHISRMEEVLNSI